MVWFLIAAATIAGEVTVTSASPEAAVTFRQGRDKALNFDVPQATLLLKAALKAEPEFPLALAWLGKLTPGAEGLSLLEKAGTLSVRLPEAERLSVAALLAERRGDDEQMRSLKRKLADVAPQDWFAQFQLGVQSFYDHKSQAAYLYLQRTIALNPQAAVAYNYLAYVQSDMGQSADAIATVRKFVELRPDEPNAHDSLGEILLLAGKYEEAEAAFRRATELSKDKWMSWVGIAYTRFFRGDWEGGREAVRRGRSLTSLPFATLQLDVLNAWSLMAEGRTDHALKALEKLEAEGSQQRAIALSERAEMLLDAGRAQDAAAEAQRALDSTSALTGNDSNRVRRDALVVQARAFAQQGKQGEAAAATASLDGELQKAPSNMTLRAATHFVHGVLALSRGDAAAGADELDKCSLNAWRCRLVLASALERAERKPAAQEARHKLRAANARDTLNRGDSPAYLWVRTQLK